MEDIHENPYAVFKVSGSIVEEEAKRRSMSMAFPSLNVVERKRLNAISLIVVQEIPGITDLFGNTDPGN